MVSYAPLNVRSHYSFHDSLLPVRTIIARATELGLPAVGLTDPNLHAEKVVNPPRKPVIKRYRRDTPSIIRSSTQP